ncbi:nitroreductase family protein [Vibrio sp. 1CM2L]|uniref:nitroreductase family protein n=1 Tax=Vibrio sp. 1CM2L TaxID=2929166 RepID=UPI0020BE2269|nr:nitroreductase family protein [Vibrio sp. 1CM2L]MCK8078710.1 nitroreductase family protein [Vibrio sp. 1CM2L]
MISSIKRILGPYREKLRAWQCAVFDLKRFDKFYSSKYDLDLNHDNLSAWILQDKHRVEKALTLPEPRLNFGEVAITRLIGNLNLLLMRHGTNEEFFFGIGALRAYKEFHENSGVMVPSFFNVGGLERYFSSNDSSRVGTINSSDLRKAHKNHYTNVFKEFCLERYSCRNYKPDLISTEEFEKVMELAIKAPSVCNRQHWKVRVFTGEEKNTVLKFQNGNLGFTENIPHVALIVSDLSAFYKANERNQPFVDGGIFAMNFIYALRAYDISSCALNWCNDVSVDKMFYALDYVDDSETVVLAIAFGYESEKARLAKSPRKNVKEFYCYEEA